ncbi:MAG: tRNA (adenosine(37)-N6)-threonylcarbamoyltransferase complex ATPase subunit type 1 TsaE [Bacteroidales bacterium]|nr:tRNA (adenosine(37)-N6)-threonylcarbamoyltransferase complex ATPase subunit type 1 TsaE [Bacteroidales bacterium]
MSQSFCYTSLAQLEEAADWIIQAGSASPVWAFYGAMGAGKTTLIKTICKKLGSQDVVTSPTFSLINEYSDAQGNSMYHFDFYRIEKKEEVLDFGYEEYIFSGAICFIEWPELVEDLLPENRMNFRIQVSDSGERCISI